MRIGLPRKFISACVVDVQSLRLPALPWQKRIAPSVAWRGSHQAWIRVPSLLRSQTSSTCRLAGGLSQPSVALTGWNRSEVSSSLPGDQLDGEEENCASAIMPVPSKPTNAANFPNRNMRSSLCLENRDASKTPQLATFETVSRSNLRR